MSQELKLQTNLAMPLIATKGYAAQEVGEAYARAYQLCQRLPDSPELFRVLRGLSTFNLLRSHLDTAQQLAEQCLRLAQSKSDPAFLLGARLVFGQVLYYLGDFSKALENFQDGTTYYNPKRDSSHAFRLPMVACLSGESWSLWHLGYPVQAKQKSYEAYELAMELNHPLSKAHALVWLSALHQLCREAPATQGHSKDAIAFSGEYKFALYSSIGTIWGGWALAHRDQPEEGIEQIRQGLAAYQSTGANLARPWFLSLLSSAYGIANQYEAALSTLDKAIARVDAGREKFCESELYRLKGDLILQAHAAETSQAEAAFQRALDVARSQRAKSLELRAAMSMSRLWQQQGKRTQARDLLASIHAWFTEGFMTVDLMEAKLLLEELNA